MKGLQLDDEMSTNSILELPMRIPSSAAICLDQFMIFSYFNG